MVIETLPQIAALDDAQRETLALELLASVQERQVAGGVSPEIVAILEERRAEFLANPQQTKSWSDVKAGILSKLRPC